MTDVQKEVAVDKVNSSKDAFSSASGSFFNFRFNVCLIY